MKTRMGSETLEHLDLQREKKQWLYFNANVSPKDTQIQGAFRRYQRFYLACGMSRYLQLKEQKRRIRILIDILLCGISIYGCSAFVKRGFPEYMSGRTMFAFFDYSEPLAFFILDYLAVMILFMMAGCLAVRILDEKGNSQRYLPGKT